MPEYEVGFIYSRCFIQKSLELPSGVKISPLHKTGSSGEIRDIKERLETARFSFTRKDLHLTLSNFSETGHCSLISFPIVRASNYITAIESKENEAENIAGALAVISANPTTPMCSFARTVGDAGVKFFIPVDRIIRHGTNIPGFLDALPEIEKKAQRDAKFSLLLRLYRASLREKEIDNQILFQLILLEEASDNEKGTFAEKLRSFAINSGFEGDLAIVAAECGVTLPVGKDVIDLLIRLRNAAAHNGNISESSLREYKGDWVIPVLHDKSKLHKLIGESIRYMFCCLVGYNRDTKAIKISTSIEIEFN
jgi:hypothetical protein